MNATIAAQMTSADLLKLRKKRGTLIWALVLALAPLVVFFIVKAAQHSSNPAQYEPAGGVHGFTDGMRLLALFFGPLAAILIGVEAGAGDSAAGVFRDLVVTGRSRLAIFMTRLPAALALCWSVITAGFALLLLGTFVFASKLPTPGGALILESLGFAWLATGAVCVVSVGFSALANSKPASLTALIGWQLIASPLIATISSLGDVRKGLLEQGLLRFRPLDIHDHGAIVAMSGGVAVIVILAWLLAFIALGAWRTRTMDA